MGPPIHSKFLENNSIWATRPQDVAPLIRQIRHLKATHDAFRKEERFVMISFSLHDLEEIGVVAVIKGLIR